MKGKAIVFLVGVALVAAACGGSGNGNARRATPSTAAETPVNGGTLVIRTSGEPGCWDPFAPCGSGPLPISALTWPRAVVFMGGKITATPLLAAEPILERGPPQRLTYRINPKAVWSDLTPITSSDFLYTWEQAVGPNVRNRAGWEQIAGVDDSDPKTAVITFKQPYAAWTNPFGALGIVLPKHLLDGKDRLAEMKDGVTWSGGPWKLDRWTKSQEVRFVPNPNYWGDKPHLDALVFKIIPDIGAAFAAYKSGQVSLLQAVPPDVTLAELKALPDTAVDVIASLAFNGLDLNTEKPPLDSTAVRQALAYATDRETLVTQAYGLLQPDIKPIQALMTPANGRWYIEPYARYHRDLARVDQLMRGAGWARAQDGIWAKGGQRAQIDLVGDSGNSTVVLQEQILQSQWKEAGFDARINNVSNRLDLLRRGAYNVGFDSDAGPSDDPSRCARLCGRSIPTDANGLSGANLGRLADPANDAAWDLVNSEVDEAKRLEALKAAYQITADLVPYLPIAPGPSLLVYNSARLRGIVNDSGPNGPYVFTTNWFCHGGVC